MSEDDRTLWVGNLSEQVTEELIYELLLQTGPIERLVFPTEGDSDSKQHKGHAYVVFRHPESVQYALQVLEGSSLFGQQLSMKARSLPISYKSAAGGRGRLEQNNSVRPSFNKATTWHGQNEFASRGRGSFRGHGTSFNQNSSFGPGFNNNYSNQGSNTGFWHQTNNENSNQAASYSTGDGSLEEKRQRLLQHQSLTLETHRQLQQGVMNMASQMYNMAQQQQQGMWAGGNYNAPNWNASGGDSSGFQGYTGDQYGNWYQQQ